MVLWASGVTSARQRALATVPLLKRETSTPGRPEPLLVGLRHPVVAQFSNERRLEPQARGVERGVGGRATCRLRRGGLKKREDPAHLGVVHQDHSPLFSGDVPEERIGNLGHEVHDRRADPGELEFGRGHAHLQGVTPRPVRLVARSGSSSISIRIEYSPGL